MQPPALRLQALRLLQLLLEDASLARLFEGSLSRAAAARCDPGMPTGTAGTSGDGAGSDTPQGPAAGGGGAPVQVEDGGGSVVAGGPWTGAAEVAERLLDSLSLDLGPQPADAAQHGSSARAPNAADAGARGVGIAALAAVPRAAMSLAAELLGARRHGILAYLLLDDACGAPGGMLAERLVQLAESAMAVPGEDGAMMLLCPLPWPQGAARGAGAAGGLPLCQQAAWQQRLRVAQEALTLLRGLLLDESCGEWGVGVPGSWRYSVLLARAALVCHRQHRLCIRLGVLESPARSVVLAQRAHAACARAGAACCSRCSRGRP